MLLLCLYAMVFVGDAVQCDAYPSQSSSHAPFVAVRIGDAAHPGPVSLDGGTFNDARWAQLPAPPGD